MAIASHAERIGSLRRTISVGLACAVATLGLCLTLGGGTRAGFLSDTLLQALSIPILLIAVWHWTPYGRGEAGAGAVRFALALVFCHLGLFVAQLIPLPPEIWSKLPGRSVAAQSFELVGKPLPWLPMSLAPDMTLLAMLSMLPAIATFVTAVQLQPRERRVLIAVLAGFAAASGFLGLLQVAQGETSALRPFEITNPTEAVGLFANRNHLAALLFTTLVFMIVLATGAVERLRTLWQEGVRQTWPIASAAGHVVGIVLLLSAIVMARSRAGMALAMLAIIGGALAARPLAVRGRKRIGGGWVAIAGVGIAAVLVTQFAVYRIIERFAVDPGADARLPFARRTIEAAWAHMPFGSGVGSFVTVYASREAAVDANASYANRAHNDFLEGWLETGVPGMILLAAFLMWLCIRGVAVWRERAGSSAGIDIALSRAAMIALLLLLAHSAMDYPLRTGAMSAVFALCCALMLPAPGARAREHQRDATRDIRPARSSSHPPPRAIAPIGPPPQPAAPYEVAWPVAPAAAQKTDITWPVPQSVPQNHEPPPAAPIEQAIEEAFTRPHQAGRPQDADWADEASWPEQWKKQPPRGKRDKQE